MNQNTEDIRRSSPVVRLRVWVDTIQHALQRRGQIGRQEFFVAACLIGILGIAAGGYSMFLSSTGKGTTIRLPLTIAVSLVLLVSAVAVYFRGVETLRAKWGMAALFAVALTAATIGNGLLPSTLTPVMVILLHAILEPAAAAWASVAIISAVFSALVLFHGAPMPELLSRLLVVCVMTLVLQQFLSRAWWRLARQVQEVGTEVSAFVKDLEDELDKVRHVDALTGLPNAAGFENQVASLLASCPEQARHAVIVMKIDNSTAAIAHLNAMYQEILFEDLVSLLRSHLPQSALLARIGPVDFVAFAELRSQGRSGFVATIDALLTQLRQPAMFGGSSAFIGPSIGIAFRPDDGDDLATLTRRAELAREASQKLGLGRIGVFDASMEVHAQDRARIAGDIYEAVVGDAFVLAYQPIVQATGGRIAKAEALIRWPREGGGIAPAAFMPIAEQSGTVVPLTFWALHQVADQVRTWRRDLHRDFSVSVNLSPVVVRHCLQQPDRCLPMLRGILPAPGAITLEITEGAVLDVTSELVRMLDELREIGYLIALDDFGVGYSAFGQLRRIPLDFLKIDRSFIQDIEADARARAICNGIVQVGRSIGCQVVAEGIETEAQRRILTADGCDLLQGFLLGRPMTADRLAETVAAQGQSIRRAS